MTALVVLENADLDAEVTVEEGDLDEVTWDSSIAGLKVGETLTVRDLLACLLVPSGNDASYVLARFVGGGDWHAFVDMMNERAAQLGCEGTHFANPCGLHDDNHYSTARDLVRIFEAALAYPEFEEIAGSESWDLPETSQNPARTLESTESLIPLKSELEQTRRYLKIERARFGDDRIIETERLAPGLDELMVPAFLVQPIVENAVRHAMRDEGPLHIDVRVGHHGNDVLISVTDDGLGMDEAVANRLLEQAKTITGSEKGAGIALRNVTERLKHLFGPDSGIEIMSKEGEGTCVTLRLAGAMAKLGDNREDDGE